MSNEKLSTNVGCAIIGGIENKNEPMLSEDTTKRKTCPKCKQNLPLEMFNRRNRNTFILNCYCKLCLPVVNHDWRVKNLAKVKHREREYRQKNRKERSARHVKWYRKWISTLESRFSNWERSAKKRNIPFDLTFDQIKSIPLTCHYTGNALTLEGNHPNTISLDRIDSSKGYTITNVVFCCSFVNIMKHKTSYEDFLSACKAIAEHHRS